MKRVVLFLITNLAVMLVLSLVSSVFGLHQFIGADGLQLGTLLLFAGLFGFGGAFISLAISKWSAKMAVGARVIAVPTNAQEKWLIETVNRQALAANIKTPEIAIYEADEVNAFATGMSRNNSLVAVSTGLLRNMTREEAEAVLGHEVSHIANGDMVTLTLIQGVLNTFVIVISRIVGYFVDRVLLKNENQGPGIGYYISFFFLEIILGVLASMVVMAFSRHREFRADQGGATLAGRQNMINALTRLQSVSAPTQLPERVAALGISGKSSWMRLFSSHPPLEERINALKRVE